MATRKETSKRKTVYAFSPREVAFVAEVPQKAVEQAIDRHEVIPIPAQRSGDSPRGLSYGSVVYMRLRKEAGDVLTSKGKRYLFERLQTNSADRVPKTVEFGSVTVETAEAVSAVQERIKRVKQMRKLIIVDENIRGGEPVVRGTRIPAYMLADMIRSGDTAEEILGDYPTLTLDALDAAVLFAKLNPRRGRPKETPWSKTKPRLTFGKGPTSKPRKKSSRPHK